MATLDISVNLEHLFALLIVGIGGLILLNSGHTEAGSTLLGGLAGYAFKNGVPRLQAKTSDAAQVATSELKS